MEPTSTLSFNQTSWREAATGGLFMGLTYTAFSLISYALRTHPAAASLCGALSICSVVGFLYFYAKRMGTLFLSTGMSYGQSFRFILRMSLFGGVIIGMGMFILYNWIDPHGIRDQIDLTASVLKKGGWGDQKVNEAVTGTIAMMKNPLLVVLAGTLQMSLVGGILGLIISFFTKRPAPPADRPNVTNLS